jgi:hypothetical protein
VRRCRPSPGKRRVALERPGQPRIIKRRRARQRRQGLAKVPDAWPLPDAGPALARPSRIAAATRNGRQADPDLGRLAPSATCNIGPAELRRRRRSAAVAVGLLAAALAALGLGLLPASSLPFLAPLVGAVMGTLLQVAMRFCIAFGFAGLIGMGDRPGATPADRALLAAHRRRAALMALAAALAALVWAAGTWAVGNGLVAFALG